MVASECPLPAVMLASLSSSKSIREPSTLKSPLTPDSNTRVMFWFPGSSRPFLMNRVILPTKSPGVLFQAYFNVLVLGFNVMLEGDPSQAVWGEKGVKE